MDRPKLAGFRSDGQPYLLTAERALQDIKHPTIVELQKVDGEIGMAGGEATHLTADAGVYDSMGEHMDLSKNVRIKNSRFDVLLRSASFDFKSGAYGSDDPVEVHVGDGTTIFADRAAALNNGQELTFEGHVRTKNRLTGRPSSPPLTQKGPIHDVAARRSRPGGGAGRGAPLLERRRRDERRKAIQPQRLGRNFPWNKFEGADLDRRRQARLLRQGTQGGLFRKCRRHSGRHENDLLGHDRLFGSRADARARRPPGARTEQRTANPARRPTSGVKHLDATGPVTVVSKTQVATGDSGSYDKAEDKVWLIGHVTLSDGQNVTKGDKLTYDLKNGQATVDTSAKSGRVHGQFVPNSSSDADRIRRRRHEGGCSEVEIGAGDCRPFAQPSDACEASGRR